MDAFLWLSVVSWGIGLGAKLFDLLVLGSAWGASPPGSLALYPYGQRWPVDPGAFFQPLSALILIASLGALASGWRIAPAGRLWLLLPVVAFIIIWIATPTLFWPVITELYRLANGRVVKSDAEVAALVRRWVVYDWLRIALIAVGFLSSIRAFRIPAAARIESRLP